MSDLLLELFSEEIPARMQASAQQRLGEALAEGLNSVGLSFDTYETASGPRRLVAAFSGLPSKSADIEEIRKGPRIGAPQKALDGFLRGAGLSHLEEAEIEQDAKKGDYYIARLTKPGKPAPALIAELIPEIIRKFHWPKSMRTGHGSLSWVRPLQRILCLFEGQVVPFEVEGVAASNLTEGHRVHGRGPYEVSSWQDYRQKLEGAGHICLLREQRREMIKTGAMDICQKAGLALVEDIGLLEEVTGLVEWPVAILGQMDKAVMELPPEVIQLSMRTHQKYFAVRDPATGELAPHFIVIANLDARDGGQQIAAGNAKVLSARLEDARFFWENDQKTGLEAMTARLKRLEFKQELGSMADKVERITSLAQTLAELLGYDLAGATRAAGLCKADLVSEMVYEFPELQGIMGRYYALAEGEDKAIANAIGEHYQPLGPAQAMPKAPLCVTLALADKLDTLIGFWAIDEKPTGSRDPFALRRSALGIVRIILENQLRLPLRPLIRAHLSSLPLALVHAQPDAASATSTEADRIVDDLLAFLVDRLKQYLRDKGERYDLIDAVFASGDQTEGVALDGQDDFVLLVNRVSALAEFLQTDNGINLLAGYKRAANILKAEEKKTGETYQSEVNTSLFQETAEQSLHAALTSALRQVKTEMRDENYIGVMQALAPLRGDVDAFFEDVIVNADTAALRHNRLSLLASLREALLNVADFSRIRTEV